MIHHRYLQLLWILAAGGVGFAVTAVGSGRLRLLCALSPAPCTAAVVALFWSHLSRSGLGVGARLMGGLEMEVDQS